MSSESMILSLFPESHDPRFQFPPVGNYVLAETVVYDVEVDKSLFHHESNLLKEGDHFMWVVTCLVVASFLSIVFGVVLELEFILDPPERSAEPVAFCPLEH